MNHLLSAPSLVILEPLPLLLQPSLLRGQPLRFAGIHLAFAALHPCEDGPLPRPAIWAIAGFAGYVAVFQLR